MTPPRVDKVCVAGQEKINCYTRADLAADALLSALEAGANPQPWVAQLAEEIHHVESLEANARAEEPGNPPRQQPNDNLGQVGTEAEIIRALREKLDRAITLALERQAELAPQLDMLILGQQMRHAYQK